MASRRKAQKPQELRVDGLCVVLTRKQVRNINLRVRRDGTVAVSASPSVPLADIENFVRSRRDWILAAQERVEQVGQSAAVCCDDGAQLCLWDRVLTIRLEAAPASGRWPRCHFVPDGDELLVRADERIADTDERSREERNHLLDLWFQEQLTERIEQLLPGCEETVGRHCSAWRLRHMTSRWGSCNVSTGVVTLSTELVHHPSRCLAYVIIHELCHLYEPSHNTRFYALMDRFCPTWREVRKELNGR